MPTIELLCMTPDVYAEIASDRFARSRDVGLGVVTELIKEVARQTEAFCALRAIPNEWGGFLAIDVATRVVVGTCAFKGGPDDRGVVEIAYFTFPPYERCGYATAMASALVERARVGDEVLVVCAHTSPEKNGSTRVLSKLGFTLIGPVDDPDDGLIWRWELPMT